MNTSDQPRFETLPQNSLATFSGGATRPPSKQQPAKGPTTKSAPGGKTIPLSKAFPSINPQNVGSTLATTVSGGAALGMGVPGAAAGLLLGTGLLAGEAAWDGINDMRNGYDNVDISS